MSLCNETVAANGARKLTGYEREISELLGGDFDYVSTQVARTQNGPPAELPPRPEWANRLYALDAWQTPRGTPTEKLPRLKAIRAAFRV